MDFMFKHFGKIWVATAITVVLCFAVLIGLGFYVANRALDIAEHSSVCQMDC